MDAKQLKEILDKHAIWLKDQAGGERADLSGANLREADLSGADLSGANLREADLSGAKAIPEIPAIEHIDFKILQAIRSPGCRLDMGNWHTCNTTHCRAGWAITLAGDCGKLLESIYGPNTAGAMIYAVSRPGKPVPDFLASNDDAMADMEKCAAESK